MLGGIWEGEVSSGPDVGGVDVGGALGDMLGDAVSSEATSSARSGNSVVQGQGTGQAVGRDELDELFGGALPPSPASLSGAQPGSGGALDLLS